MSAERHLGQPHIAFGRVVVNGISSWSVQQGCLIREHVRTTTLRSEAEIRRWAARAKIDPEPTLAEFRKLTGQS